MPSLVSTGSGEEDATEADLPTSEEASDSDGDDELPALIADDSGSEDSDIEDQANQQHISASIIGMDADFQMLESWLQPPAAMPATANPAAEHASVGSDGALDGPDSDMEMPPLVDMASFDGLVGAASGRHTPLDLDQQAALDDLSLDMDEATDLIERVTQVANWCCLASNSMASPCVLSSCCTCSCNTCLVRTVFYLDEVVVVLPTSHSKA